MNMMGRNMGSYGITAVAILFVGGCLMLIAELARAQQPTPQPMSFVVTCTGAVNARDRIGKGPWFNAKGARIAQDVGDLHGDTLEQARRGNNLTKATALTEKGQPVNGLGDNPNQHDILTGSQLDGTAFPAGGDRTCRNWTSNTGDSAQLGHVDRMGGGNTSWNSEHASKGCSQQNLVATGGAGLLYCFAIE